MAFDSEFETKVKIEPVTPTMPQGTSGQVPKPVIPVKRFQKAKHNQHQESSPSAAQRRQFQRPTGPAAEILQNVEDQLESLRVVRRATSFFSFDEIELTQEEIEEIEDAHEEDASCLRGGEITFFERAVRGRIEDEHWRARRLKPANSILAQRSLVSRNPFLDPVARKGYNSGENVGGLGPADHPDNKVRPAPLQALGGNEKITVIGDGDGGDGGNQVGEPAANGGGKEEESDDSGVDVGPDDATGMLAGEDGMKNGMSETDPNEEGSADVVEDRMSETDAIEGNSDEPVQAPITPQRPKVRAVYSTSAPHVKREALPLNPIEQGFIDRKRQGDEQAAIARYRYLHLAKKRDDWVGLAVKELEKAFTLDDIRGTDSDSVNDHVVKKRKIE
ncbi:hypothetical protein BJ165DRAFT_1401364 [Panaeolus papilionaceus]|nr:hypothetical protein BJ165DRAFT_1401364 [Panaeolus papilionaceus]